jgi:acyl-[acyl carrier protein]--UDP-N-acetylglucosamine O-acyltransferase
MGEKKELSGMVAVKIFVSAGEGQSRIMEISDILDNVLQYKKLNNGTELNTSYLNVEGLDPSNKALYSASYIIPFKIYGE